MIKIRSIYLFFNQRQQTDNKRKTNGKQEGTIKQRTKQTKDKTKQNRHLTVATITN